MPKMPDANDFGARQFATPQTQVYTPDDGAAVAAGIGNLATGVNAVADQYIRENKLEEAKAEAARKEQEKQAAELQTAQATSEFIKRDEDNKFKIFNSPDIPNEQRADAYAISAAELTKEISTKISSPFHAELFAEKMGVRTGAGIHEAHNVSIAQGKDAAAADVINTGAAFLNVIDKSPEQTPHLITQHADNTAAYVRAGYMTREQKITSDNDFISKAMDTVAAKHPDVFLDNLHQVPNPSFGGNNAASPNYGLRPDGTPKGTGFLGELKRPDGNVSTEISVGVNIGGKDMDIPTLVPDLTKPEISSLLNGDSPSDAIVQKAVDHAKMRISQGKSVFADNSESPGSNVTYSSPVKAATMKAIFGIEGGLNASDGHTKAPANFGINERFNQPEGWKNVLSPEDYNNLMTGMGDAIETDASGKQHLNVRKLDQGRAAKIYDAMYWKQIDGDHLPPGIAPIAMNTAVNSGIGPALNLIRAANGDVEKAKLISRHTYAVAETVHNNAQFHDMWAKRESQIEALADSMVRYVPKQGVVQNDEKQPNLMDIFPGATPDIIQKARAKALSARKDQAEAGNDAYLKKFGVDYVMAGNDITKIPALHQSNALAFARGDIDFKAYTQNENIVETLKSRDKGDINSYVTGETAAGRMTQSKLDDMYGGKIIDGESYKVNSSMIAQQTKEMQTDKNRQYYDEAADAIDHEKWANPLEELDKRRTVGILPTAEYDRLVKRQTDHVKQKAADNGIAWGTVSNDHVGTPAFKEHVKNDWDITGADTVSNAQDKPAAAAAYLMRYRGTPPEGLKSFIETSLSTADYQSQGKMISSLITAKKTDSLGDNILEGLPDKVRNKVSLAQSAIETGMDSAKAAENADKILNPSTPELEIRQKNIQKKLEIAKGSGPAKDLYDVEGGDLKSFWGGNPAGPQLDMMRGDFNKYWTAAFTDTNSEKIATKTATDTIRKLYAPSAANSGLLMKDAPELRYGIDSDTVKKVMNDAAKAAKVPEITGLLAMTDRQTGQPFYLARDKDNLPIIGDNNKPLEVRFSPDIKQNAHDAALRSRYAEKPKAYDNDRIFN